MKLLAFGFAQANPAATESSSPSSAETLPSSIYKAEKFTESPSIHKTSMKQEDTTNSNQNKMQVRPNRHQPIQKAIQDQILLLAFLRWNCVPNFGVLSMIFSQFCPGAFSQNTWIKPCVVKQLVVLQISKSQVWIALIQFTTVQSFTAQSLSLSPFIVLICLKYY